MVSPRFPTVQGGKTRVIDDMTFSCINCCVGSVEKLELQSVDSIATLIRSLMKKGIGDLEGRTYDLEAAYRQLPVHPDHRKFVVVSIYDPHAGTPRCYQLATIPFGAVTAVYSFLRVAASLNHIVSSLLKIPLTSYFDDFTVLSRKGMTVSTNLVVTTLFQVLGMRLSSSERKNHPFSETFSALGVGFDLTKTLQQILMIRNTEDRVADLTSRIDKILESGKIDPKEAKSFRSRLNFADGQLYGRTMASVLKDLGRYESSRPGYRIDQNTVRVLGVMRGYAQGNYIKR